MGSPEKLADSSEPNLDESGVEKIATVDQIDIEDFQKSDLCIDDEAGIIAAKALASEPADAEISRRVLRKIDWYILPFLCITYGKLRFPGPEYVEKCNSLMLCCGKASNSWTRRPWDTPASSAS